MSNPLDRSPFDGNGNNDPRNSRSLGDGNNDGSPTIEGNSESHRSRFQFDDNNNSHHARSRSRFDENNNSLHSRYRFDDNDDSHHSRSRIDGINGSRSRSRFDDNNNSHHSRYQFESNNDSHDARSRSRVNDNNNSLHSRYRFDDNDDSHHSRSRFDDNDDLSLSHPMFNLQLSSSPSRSHNQGSSDQRRINPFGINHESQYEAPSGGFFLPQMNPQNLVFHQSQTSPPPPPSSYSWNPNINVRYPFGQSHPQNPVQTSARGERQDFSLQTPIIFFDNPIFPSGHSNENKEELDQRLRNFPDLPKEAHMKVMEMGNQILDYFGCQLAWFEDNGNMRETTRSHVLFVKKERTGQSWLMAFTPFKGKFVLSYNRLITKAIQTKALSSTAVELEPSWSKKNSVREQCVFNFSKPLEASKFIKYIDDLRQSIWDLEIIDTERRRHDILRASSEAQLARLAQSPPLEEEFDIPMPRLLPPLTPIPDLPPLIRPPPPPSRRAEERRADERRNDDRRAEERRTEGQLSMFPHDRQTSQYLPREFSSPIQNSGLALRNVFSGNIYNTGSAAPSHAEVCGGGNSARRSFCQSSVEVKYMEALREWQVKRNVRDDSRLGGGRFDALCRKIFSAPVKLFVKKILRSFDDDDGVDYREIAIGTIVVQEKENELFREVCFYDVDGKLMMCHIIYAWNYIDLFSNSPLGTQKSYVTCIWNGQSFLSLVPSPYPVIREFKAIFTQSIDASEFVVAFLDGVSKGKDLVEGKMKEAARFNRDPDSDSNNESSTVSNWFN